MPRTKPKKRTFDVTFTVSAKVTIDQRLLDDVLTDEWRGNFYNLQDPGAVAEHVAYNFLRGGTDRVNNLDGFADQKENAAVVTEMSWDDAESHEVFPSAESSLKRTGTGKRRRGTAEWRRKNHDQG